MDFGYALIRNEMHSGGSDRPNVDKPASPKNRSRKTTGVLSLATIERIIPAVVHDDGSVHYTSVTSPSDDSIAICHVVPDRVIPVIFVPGIMGSNLQNTEKNPVWVVNRTSPGHDIGPI